MKQPSLWFLMGRLIGLILVLMAPLALLSFIVERVQ